MVNGYPNEYAQILLNILMNARDALVERNVDDPRISRHAFSEEGKTVVTITDNAGGIAEEIMDRIFDPSFTSRGPDKGTGIGLYMSKTIIEKNMGGSLTARNTGKGADFRIEV
jgi:C4-dicarboxylate-specific signal transduction histidine kinase